jgi:hypothetical protein
MAISERTNPDQLNIYKFQEMPEVVRPDLPFDVDRDVSKNTKQELLAEINLRKISFIDYCSLIGDFKNIWPDESLDQPFTPDDAVKEYHKYMESGEYSLAVVASMVLTYPELSKEITADHWDTLELVMLENKSKNNYSALINDLSNLKIINPNKSYPLTPEETVAIEEAIQTHQDTDDVYREILVSASLKLVEPLHDIPVSQAKWKSVVDTIEDMSAKQSPTAKLWLILSAKILAAYRTNIISPGVIEFQMYPPGDVNDSTPSIPEKRKF